MQLVLSFQRTMVHPVHDTKRLEEGKDLNDALMDFFVKLGQVLIPENGLGVPPVAYLGSHFYDVLRKGGATDGRDGHGNVANWARRRLGKDGLFSPGVGALAVPVNEKLVASSFDGRQEQTQEKHWWLALLLNPNAASGAPCGEDKDLSMLCLDSFVRAETRFAPPVRALRDGTNEAYPVEVSGLSRVGFNVKVYFTAKGDGSAGALPEPKTTKLRAGGREFPNTEADLKCRDPGGAGRPGRLEGALGFRLDRRGAAKTVGQYNLDFGDRSDRYDAVKLRMGEKPTQCQQQVAQFLGGYLEKERESAYRNNQAAEPQGAKRVESAIRLPGVPQQETSHDCGFFIMEMILRTLQLSPRALRELATASSVEVAMLPWPSQQQIVRRKAMLRDVVEVLLEAAQRHGTGDVEELFEAQPELRARVRAALTDCGPNFVHGYDRWAAGDWDLSASASRSNSRERKSSKDRAGGKTVPSEKRADEKREKRDRSSSSSREGGRGKKKKRRRRRRDSSSSSSSRRSSTRSPSRSRRRSKSDSGSGHGKERDKALKQASTPGAQLANFTMKDLESFSVGMLRRYCEERNVMPAGVIERTDLVKALSRFAVVSQPVVGGSLQTAGQAKGGTAAAAPTTAKADQPHCVGRFTRAVLDTMPVKDLRSLCVQKGVLPPPPLERTDLVRALVPFAVPG